MAKKKKQKKASLLKRQKNKREKKRLLKKKTKANKPAAKKISASKLKRNIKNLPCLIFEPELREIAFSKEQIEEAESKYEKMPERIEAVADQEFLAAFSEQIGKMKERFGQEGDMDKEMMVHAVEYFIAETNPPPFGNQLIVAMYHETLAKSQDPEAVIDTAALNLFIQQYEEEWQDYIEEKLDPLKDAKTKEEPTDFAAEDDEDVDFMISTPFESLIEEFVDYLKLDSTLDEEATTRAEDDVGALLNDYLEEKGVDTLEGLTPRKVKTFLDGWFPRVMHPTDEDTIVMLDSLERFFKFAKDKEKIAAEKTEEFLKLFQERKNAE